MKRNFFASIIALVLFNGLVCAQKFCFVDTDFLLNQSSAYLQAQEQLNKLSVSWQKEVEGKYAQIDALYKNFQQEQLLLTDDLRQKGKQKLLRKKRKQKNFRKLNLSGGRAF